MAVCPLGCPNSPSTCKGIHYYGSGGRIKASVEARRDQLHIRTTHSKINKKIKLEMPEPTASPVDQYFDLTVDEDGTGISSGKASVNPYLLEDLINQEEQIDFDQHLSAEFGCGISGIKSPDEITLTQLDSRFKERLFKGHQTKSYSSKDRVAEVVKELESKLTSPALTTNTCSINADKRDKTVSTFVPLSPLRDLLKFTEDKGKEIVKTLEKSKTKQSNKQSIKVNIVKPITGQYRYTDNREELSRRSTMEKLWDLDILKEHDLKQQKIDCPKMEGLNKRAHPSEEINIKIKRSKLEDKQIIAAKHKERLSFYEPVIGKVTRGLSDTTFGLPRIGKRQIPAVTNGKWDSKLVTPMSRLDHEKAKANLIPGYHTVSPDPVITKKRNRGKERKQSKWAKDTAVATGQYKPQQVSTAPHKVGPLCPRPVGGIKKVYVTNLPSLPVKEFRVSLAFVWNRCISCSKLNRLFFTFDPYDESIKGRAFGTKFEETYRHHLRRVTNEIFTEKRYPTTKSHNFRHKIHNLVWLTLYEMLLAKFHAKPKLARKDESLEVTYIYNCL